MAVPEQCKKCIFVEYHVNNTANSVLKGETDIVTAVNTVSEFISSKCDDGPRRVLKDSVSLADCGAFTSRDKKPQEYAKPEN